MVLGCASDAGCAAGHAADDESSWLLVIAVNCSNVAKKKMWSE